MLCQMCQEKPSSVHITQIINNEKKEMYLCEDCARNNQQASFIKSFNLTTPFSISDFLTGFLGNNFPAYQIKPQQQVYMPKCDVCGMTYDEFSRIGKVGCANCYTVFESVLESVFKRVHGNTYHNGKMPRRSGGKIRNKRELGSLKSQLLRAVQKEEYEQAAELRDKIKELEIQLEEE